MPSLHGSRTHQARCFHNPKPCASEATCPDITRRTLRWTGVGFQTERSLRNGACEGQATPGDAVGCHFARKPVYLQWVAKVTASACEGPPPRKYVRERCARTQIAVCMIDDELPPESSRPRRGQATTPFSAVPLTPSPGPRLQRAWRAHRRAPRSTAYEPPSKAMPSRSPGCRRSRGRWRSSKARCPGPHPRSTSLSGCAGGREGSRAARCQPWSPSVRAAWSATWRSAPTPAAFVDMRRARWSTARTCCPRTGIRAWASSLALACYEWLRRHRYVELDIETPQRAPAVSQADERAGVRGAQAVRPLRPAAHPPAPRAHGALTAPFLLGAGVDAGARRGPGAGVEPGGMRAVGVLVRK